jgi:hypothetical protein
MQFGGREFEVSRNDHVGTAVCQLQQAQFDNSFSTSLDVSETSKELNGLLLQ